MNILIVDDEKAIKESLISILNIAFNDLNIFSADEGNSALEIINQNDISLLITDINMPNGMGGEELIKRIEHSFKGQIVVITGYDRNIFLKEHSKVTHLLEKPFDIQILLNIVKDLHG